MQRDYIDLVVCKHKDSDKRYLFRAPAWSSLEEGQDVIVETSNGLEPAIVVTVNTFDNDCKDTDTQFILKSMGATWPLKKVVSKIVVKELDYRDYEKEETINEQTEQTEEQEA